MAKLRTNINRESRPLERFLDSRTESLGIIYRLEPMEQDSRYYWSNETTEQIDKEDNQLIPLNYWLHIVKGYKEIKWPIIFIKKQEGGLYGYDFRGYRLTPVELKEKLIRDIENI